jgi:hypothetical protein
VFTEAFALGALTATPKDETSGGSVVPGGSVMLFVWLADSETGASCRKGGRSACRALSARFRREEVELDRRIRVAGPSCGVNDGAGSVAPGPVGGGDLVPGAEFP